MEAGSNQKNLEHFFLEGPHSSRKLRNEQKLRGTLFCVPKGGSGNYISEVKFSTEQSVKGNSQPNKL